MHITVIGNQIAYYSDLPERERPGADADADAEGPLAGSQPAGLARLGRGHNPARLWM